MAKTILGIAMAEMIHLQKIRTVDLSAWRNHRFFCQTPEWKKSSYGHRSISIYRNMRKKMLLADIESEKGAIYQYRMHMRMIKDNYINAVLARIIKDEEYHIMMLQMLVKEM